MFLFFRSRDNLCLAVGRISYALNTRRFKLRRYDADNTKYLLTYETSWDVGYRPGFFGVVTRTFFIGYVSGFCGFMWKHVKGGVSWAKPQENNDFFSE
jgi:hypothetical protein